MAARVSNVLSGKTGGHGVPPLQSTFSVRKWDRKSRKRNSRTSRLLPMPRNTNWHRL